MAPYFAALRVMQHTQTRKTNEKVCITGAGLTMGQGKVTKHRGLLYKDHNRAEGTGVTCNMKVGLSYSSAPTQPTTEL